MVFWLKSLISTANVNIIISWILIIPILCAKWKSCLCYWCHPFLSKSWSSRLSRIALNSFRMKRLAHPKRLNYPFWWMKSTLISWKLLRMFSRNRIVSIISPMSSKASNFIANWKSNFRINCNTNAVQLISK